MGVILVLGLGRHGVPRRADRRDRGHGRGPGGGQARTDPGDRVRRDRDRPRGGVVRRHARRLQAGDPDGGPGERPQQPLDRGRPHLQGPPDRRGRPRELPGVRAALRQRPRRAHVRELHSRAAARGAQRVPADPRRGRARGPRPLPGDHPQLAGAPRCARRGGSRAGETTTRRRSRRAVFVGLLAALVASFFISNGNGFQIWVLLAFGPMLHAAGPARGGLRGAAHARRRRPRPATSRHSALAGSRPLLA